MLVASDYRLLIVFAVTNFIFVDRFLTILFGPLSSSCRFVSPLHKCFIHCFKSNVPIISAQQMFVRSVMPIEWSTC